MMFGSKRGISQTPFLIVFVILFLLASGMAWWQTQEKQDAQDKVLRREAEYDDMEDRFRAKVEELERICTVTGYFERTEEGDEAMMRSETVISDHIALVNKKLDPVLPQRQQTCKTMIDELGRQIDWRVRKLKEQNLNLETKDNKISDGESTKIRLLNEKKEYIDQLKDEARRNQERLEQNIQAYERQVTDLRERIKNLSAENERINEERRAEVQKLGTDVKSLQARVIALARREQIEETFMPDGRVTRADIDQGYAYIDLGAKDGIRSGQRFKVYSVLKGGRRKQKGEVRIIRVEKDFSQCSILVMMDTANPIVQGDYIWNKFFVRGRKLIFVFIGSFGGENVQYTKEHLKKVVQDAGHIASDQVHASTYYAVLGDDYMNDPQYKRVQDYRIDKIKPRDLFDYFGFGRFE